MTGGTCSPGDWLTQCANTGPTETASHFRIGLQDMLLRWRAELCSLGLHVHPQVLTIGQTGSGAPS
jgi:hypothetical protein